MTKIVNEVNIQLPLVLTDDEAAQIADRMLYQAWVQRETYEIRLPIKYLYLDPGDVISTTVNGRSYTMRIETIDFAVPGILTFKCKAEDPAVYSSTAVGSAGIPTEQNFGLVSDTKLVLMDIPPLRSSDTSSPVFYAAATGYSSTWRAAVLYKSYDEGQTYAGLESLLTPATIGSANGTLADGNIYTWDMQNTLNISLIYGTLSSDTEANILAGLNSLLVGSEIIQFLNATLEGDGSYTVSGLLRGRLGTDWATGLHTTGETVTKLETSSLLKLDIPTTDLNTEYPYKGVTTGLTVQGTTAQNFNCTGVNMKPFSPVYIEGARDGSNNLTITWNRRSRILAQAFWTPSLGEDTEEYEIDIMSGATVARTISSISSETSPYSAADQVTDGFTAGDPIDVRIFQISATVGRGYAGVETV